ncbi:MAG: transketolase family protein [Butyricicoccus sp.]
MSITLIGKHEKDSRACRDAYVEAMLELMEADPSVMHVDCDLESCINTGKLAKAFPERTINAGIAEANAMGVAAGLTATGKKVWMHSFGCFSSRRAFDQAFMSAAYAKLGVKILGSDPGVCAAYNGGTHMPFEDCALYLSVPDAIVIDPVDYAQVYSLTKKLTAVDEKISYMRMIRKGFTTVYADGSDFEIGKGVTLKESDKDDVTVIASGIMVDEALKAYEALQAEGINIRVIDMFTWKPIDEDLIVKAAKETGAIVTAENHNCTCGLGSAVARVLSAKAPTPVEMVGVHDQFGQVGAQNFLQEAYKLTAEEIIANVKKVMARK